MGDDLEKIEIRNLSVEFETSDDDLVVVGRVNDLGWSKLLGTRKRFIEKIEKGTFTRAIEKAKLRKRPIDLLGNHDETYLLASTQNNSLSLEEREDGLYMKAKISDTDYGRRFYTLAKDGLFAEMSFGFSINENGERWEKQADGTYKRFVNDIELYECSIVREGAYNNTSVKLQNRGFTLVEDPNIPEDELELNEIETEIREINLVEELINKVAENMKNEMAQQYEAALAILNDKIDNLSQMINKVEEVKVDEVVEQPTQEKVEEIQEVPQVQVEEVQVTEAPKFDVSQFQNEIEKLKGMKEVVENDN